MTQLAIYRISRKYHKEKNTPLLSDDQKASTALAAATTCNFVHLVYLALTTAILWLLNLVSIFVSVHHQSRDKRNSAATE